MIRDFLNNPVKRDALVQQLCICFGYLMLGLSINGPLGPRLRKLVDLVLDGHTSSSSLWFVSRGVGAMLGALVLGGAFDRLDCRVPLSSSVFTMSFSVLLVPLAVLGFGGVLGGWPAFLGVGASSLLLGAALGAFDSGGNAIVPWIWGGAGLPRLVAPCVQMLHFCFGIGSILAGVFAAGVSFAMRFVAPTDELADTWSFHAFFLLLAAAIALPVAPMLLMPSPPRPQEETGILATSASSSTSSTRLPPTPPLVTGLLSLILLVYVGAEVGYGALVSAYVQRDLPGLRWTRESGALLTSFYWLTFTVGRLLAIPLSLFFTPTQLIVGDIFLCVSALSVFCLFPTAGAALWLATGVLGLGMASIFPCVITIPPHRGFEVSATATRFLILGASAGELVVPTFVALVLDLYAEAIGFAILAAILAVSALYLALEIYLWKSQKAPAAADDEDASRELEVVFVSPDGSDSGTSN